MLRITVNEVEGFTCLMVEGSLTEPSAEELKRCWQEVCALGPGVKRLSVDLTAMTNIDSIGKDILTEIHRSGVELIGSGVMTRAVIEAIARRE